MQVMKHDSATTQNAGRSVSERDLEATVRSLGIGDGSVLLVHASLSAFGDVIGGEQAVIDALQAAIGPAGTLVMPSQSWQLCDPEYLAPGAMAFEECARIRENLPVFDVARTPTRSMGAVAELFRTLPGVRRSRHPHRSFAALGPEAAGVTAEQNLDSPFDDASPLARLYDLDAVVLLLGVGFDKATALHLAEWRSRARLPRVPNGAPMLVGGERRWVTWEETLAESEDFEVIGDAFRSSSAARSATVGRASCEAMSLRELVDFGASWMNSTRKT